MKKKWLVGGSLVLGLIAAGGWRHYMREKATAEPDYLDVEKDGEFAVRDYLPVWVAETFADGTRREAIRAGFRTLADYIFARSHDGDEIPMTSPVLESHEDGDRWRVAFVMPAGANDKSLPSPPPGVSLRKLPARRVGVVCFSGAPGDYNLEKQEQKLLGWLTGRGYAVVGGKPDYAFFNSPSIPGPLRRNEVWLEVALEEPIAT